MGQRNEVAEILPDLSEEDRVFAVWNLTAFPCCGKEHMIGQLREVADKLKAGVSLAQQMAAVEAEMDRLMDEARTTAKATP